VADNPSVRHVNASLQESSARLDKWLSAVRLFKSRALATDACRAGSVQVNDLPAKAGKEVQAGDIITIRLRNRIVKVRVDQIPQQAISKKDAVNVYTMLAETQIKEEALL